MALRYLRQLEQRHARVALRWRLTLSIGTLIWIWRHFLLHDKMRDG